jgi:transposase
MSQRALSMRKIKEVLRLRYDLGLLQSEIARSCSISQSSVNRYLERASDAGLSWPLPQDCDDRRLNELLFPAAPADGRLLARAPLDCAALHRQLQSHKYVTLQLLWEEYRQSQPEGYRYSRFCELYQRWRGKQDLVLRQQHRAGEKIFVDWAGATIPIYDRETGEARPASLFVAALGARSYTFAHATISQDLPNWIECHILAFEFFQGTSQLIVPDNPRTGVTRACRYEPDLNRTYLEMAQFYHVAIMPARPYKARDKTWVS